MGRRKRKSKPRGFSDKSTKASFDALSMVTGIRGSEKRGVFNQISVCIATCFALVSGFTGCLVYSEASLVVGGIVGLVVGTLVFNAAMRWASEGRFFRP
jgi:hypothetical protein